MEVQLLHFKAALSSHKAETTQVMSYSHFNHLLCVRQRLDVRCL